MTGFPDAAFGAELVAALNAELGADSAYLFTTSRERPERGPVSVTDGRSRVPVLTANETYILTFVQGRPGVGARSDPGQGRGGPGRPGLDRRYRA